MWCERVRALRDRTKYTQIYLHLAHARNAVYNNNASRRRFGDLARASTCETRLKLCCCFYTAAAHARSTIPLSYSLSLYITLLGARALENLFTKIKILKRVNYRERARI